MKSDLDEQARIPVRNDRSHSESSQGRLDERPAARKPPHPSKPLPSPFRRPENLLGPFNTGLDTPERGSPDASACRTPSPLSRSALPRDLQPAMLNSLELRLQGPFHGSTTLPHLESPGVRAPATGFHKRSRFRNFESAKHQVNRDLQSYSADTLAMLKLEQAKPQPDPQVLNYMTSLLAIVKEIMETNMKPFKETITDLVASLEEMRKQCEDQRIRALITRLLFILTRCSRLILSEDAGHEAENDSGNMYGTCRRPPRSAWKRAGLPMTGVKSSMRLHPSRARTPVMRTLTLPTRTLSDIFAGFQNLNLSSKKDPAGGLDTLAESSTVSSPRASPFASGQQTNHRTENDLACTPTSQLRRQNSSGDIRCTYLTKRSPLGRNIVTALEAELDQVAHDSPKPFRGDRSRLEQRSAHSSPARLGSITKRRPEKSALKRDKGLMAGLKRFQKKFTKAPGGKESQFQVLSPCDEETASSDGANERLGASFLGLDNSDSSPASSPIRSLRQPLPARTVSFLSPLALRSTTASPAQLHIEIPSNSGQSTPKSPAASSISPFAEEHALRGESWLETECNESAATDILDSQLSTPDNRLFGAETELVVCRICENQVAVQNIEEHSNLCSLLDESIGNIDVGIDACLTKLATFAEGHADELSSRRGTADVPDDISDVPDEIEDLVTLVLCTRAAAALQPDSTTDPAQFCKGYLRQIQEVVQRKQMESSFYNMVDLLAERAAALVTAKVEELEGFLRGYRETVPSSCEGTPPPSGGLQHPALTMDIQDFKLLKPISRGSYGRVYLCEKKTTKDLFAIKIMRKADLVRKNMVRSVRNERNILAMTNNPFVVSFYYSFTNATNLYIVMEYCNGGDCYNLLKGLGCMDEQIARLYIAETILALEYCHTKGIIHRDLKPENLLIGADGHIKLTDFGLSTFGIVDSSSISDESTATAMNTDSNASSPASRSQSNASSPRRWSVQNADIRPRSADVKRPPERYLKRSRTSLSRPSMDGSELGVERMVVSKEEAERTVGTPDYLAPELLLGTGHGPEVDWWSLGVILYEFVCGVPPFAANTPEEIFEKILDRQLTWPEDPESQLSEQCKDLIDQLLDPDPHTRLGSRGAGEVKLHPFFQANPENDDEGINWKELVTQKAAFIPSSESRLAPSMYFEEKPISKRSMELDTQSERDELSRRGTHALPSPANSMKSKHSRSRSRKAVQFPTESLLDRITSRDSGASSLSSMSMQSQIQSPGLAPQSLQQPSNMLPTAAGLVLQSRNQEAQTEEQKRNSCELQHSPASESTASSGELVQQHVGDFADWTYKNVDLLKDRNREMAEQAAVHRHRQSDSSMT